MPLDSVTPRPPKDIPIIFSEAMVRAQLADLKTQTRRLATSPLAKVQPGDRLWVRENHWLFGRWREDGKTGTGRVRRVFDKIGQTATFEKPGNDNMAYWGGGTGFTWKPAMHMPRWASRITLVVEDVRFQRLQDITEEDARAEGAEPCANGWWFDQSPVLAGCDARGAFYCLWNTLHDKPGERWEDNPEIVALGFAVHRCNIEGLPTQEAAHVT
ncbi:hypothetical protein [Azospirillum argentinense]|uniref:Uncharacterized protein n=1 Tax=Azospirillum brasilense TaxID=192 RepID=A0A4D8Q0N7_AZOBR|nr:hypothetical protein [Azospirillum argentinense]QCO03433.1 hypothetical protein D3867_15275 [Azospirillum argentinense]